MRKYLKELHKRNKWQKPEENFKVVWLAVIKDENLPPNIWRLGRVQRVYLGSDSLVRDIDISTACGTINRHIHKLILLPTDN
ncbi:hypothetical protein CVS40_11660 [Lucilia cuprina]|nr:hypothetical protein CVS40_11660 [Lucilia cuprina]